MLKGLTTERPQMITKKGLDSIMTVNCVKLAISSNSDWVVPASHDERRYAVNDIHSRYARGAAPEDVRKEYFGAIVRELREGGGRRCSTICSSSTLATGLLVKCRSPVG